MVEALAAYWFFVVDQAKVDQWEVLVKRFFARLCRGEEDSCRAIGVEEVCDFTNRAIRTFSHDHEVAAEIGSRVGGHAAVVFESRISGERVEGVGPGGEGLVVVVRDRTVTGGDGSVLCGEDGVVERADVEYAKAGSGGTSVEGTDLSLIASRCDYTMIRCDSADRKKERLTDNCPVRNHAASQDFEGTLRPPGCLT